MKKNKKEIAEILGVSIESLKKIEGNKTLEEKLKNKGYKFINKFKEGRKVFYEIELINESQEVLSNLCNHVYKVKRKKEEFCKYYMLRTDEDNIPRSKADISKDVEISKATIDKWDNKLIELKIISKDGFFYFSIDKNTNEINQCTEEEYKTFWKNSHMLKAFNDLQIKYLNGEITLNQLQLASADIGAFMVAISNKYYFRTKKYKVNKDNKLYIDTKTLIEEVFKSKFI